jgi:parallel beta-helix repeat protein
MDGVTQSIIENNSFFNCSVRIQDSYHNRFTNNTFNGKPLVVLEDTSDVIIQDAGQVVLIECTNVTVVNTTIMGVYIGIWLQHSQYCTITANYLKDCFEGGIYLEWSDNNNITNNVIDNCYVGLLLGGSHYNKVQTNHIKGNIECPMFMSMAEQNVIDQNTFDNNTDLLTMLYGIYLTGGTNNNDITNNILINDTFYIHNAWQNRFINNTINGKPFIFLEGTSGNVIDYPVGQIILISCNGIEVRNQPDIVMYVFGCNNCIFDNMSLRVNKVVSLYILYSQHINITNCVFSEGGYGVQIRDGSHFVIQNSIFRKNIYVALNIVNCTDVVVEHNSFEENGGFTHPSLGPAFFGSSKSVEVRRNNFIGNVKGALFDQCKRGAIIWDKNYWDEPRTSPKPVPGIRFFLVFFCIYRFDFDWHPAQEPYEI